MAIGAKPAGAALLVEPRMMRRKIAVKTISAISAGDQRVAAGRGLGIAVRGEAARGKARDLREDEEGDEGAEEAADDLRDPVGDEVLVLEAARDREAERDRRIEVAAGNAAHREGHREDREARGERDADPADADLRHAGRADRARADGKDEPEGAECFGGQFSDHWKAPKCNGANASAVPNRGNNVARYFGAD